MTVHVEGLRRRTATLRLDLARFLPATILAGYGILILSLFLRHVMTLYINPTYVGPTTLGGAVLVGLAAAQLRKGAAASCGCGDAACCGDGCGCAEDPPKLRTYALLAIPLLFGTLFPPRALAGFSATQRGPQIAGLTAFHAGTVSRISLSVDTASFSLQDWAGALSADPNPADYRGKTVNLTGMVLHDAANVPSGYIMVLRYQVTCCIADARPVGLIVRDTSGGTLRDNQWVTVHGVMGSARFQGQSIAVVEPRKMVQVKAGNPYMY